MLLQVEEVPMHGPIPKNLKGYVYRFICFLFRKREKINLNK